MLSVLFSKRERTKPSVKDRVTRYASGSHKDTDSDTSSREIIDEPGTVCSRVTGDTGREVENSNPG